MENTQTKPASETPKKSLLKKYWKIIAAIAIAVAGYFGYNVIVTPVEVPVAIEVKDTASAISVVDSVIPVIDTVVSK